MRLFRNKEVFISIITAIGVTIAASVAAFLWSPKYGIFTCVVCMELNVIHFGNMYYRYQKIQELSADIDRILHGDTRISFEKYAEGELAVLESEIYKMTVRLREQQQSLLDDKKYLADAIADISHQIRTPLTSMNLLLSFLSEPEICEEKRAKTLRELNELSGRIDWLIHVLLKISKLDAGTISFQTEKTAFKKLLEKSLEPLLIPIELHEIELEMNIRGSFWGDIHWMSEAVGNVIKNCMEHTPRGGKICINAQENPLYAELVISDTGCGIDKEDLPHIFERFYKGKNSSEKSFGVGLALARMIITRQNGTIKAENKSEGGAVFTIRFYHVQPQPEKTVTNL